MELRNFDTRIMKVVQPLTTKVISDVECRGAHNNHACHLSQFVRLYLRHLWYI